LNHHLSVLLGVSSLAWRGHLVHVAIPASRGTRVCWYNFLNVLPHYQGLKPFFTGNWIIYAQYPDAASHVFGTNRGAGEAILTFLGGFHPNAKSLFLGDIAHHHLAFAVLCIVRGHIYRTKFDIGHSLRAILDSHVSPSGRLGSGHRHLYFTVNDSLHFQLGLALASVGRLSSLVAQHICTTPICVSFFGLYNAIGTIYTSSIYCRI
jgi:photosystem I P700 chlorophyll a apoprotein A2